MSKQIGDKGETIAANYLIENGFTILERNWRYKHLEIDIIASKNNFLHFVEVKTRTNELFGKPEESIDDKKMNRLKKAAEAYLQMHENWLHIQFDVVAISLKKNTPVEIFFIEDVFF